MSTNSQYTDQIVEKLDVGLIIVDREQHITLWNPWIARASKIPDDQALGKRLDELFPEIRESRLMDCVSDAIGARMSSYLTRAFNPHPLPLWSDAISKSGERMFQEISVSPIGSTPDNHCLIRVRDVSADHYREAMLRRHEAFFRGLLDDQYDPMLRIRTDGIITFINKAACVYFGAKEGQNLSGENLRDYVDNGIIDMFAKRVAVCTPSSPLVRMGHVEHFFPQGQCYFDITLRCFYDDKGELGEIQIFAHDTTERTQKEMELRKQWKQLRETTLELTKAKAEADRLRFAAETANRAKSEFLANMSHELRTPLNSIMGFAEIIADRIMGDNWDLYSDYAQSIVQSGQHLLSLINDVLDLSKVEAGKMQLYPEELDIGLEVEEIVESVKVMAAQKGIVIDDSLGEDPIDMYADRRSMRQVVLNLMSNAIKFTPQSGTIQVTLTEGEGHVVLKVTDNGIGIPPSDLQKVFEPFEQVRSNYLANEGGTGLGLSLVRRLVELHGGTVEISSKPADGTTVTVKLPLNHLNPSETTRAIA